MSTVTDSSPHGDPVARLLDRLANVRRSGVGWTARCPNHEDRRNSLSVASGDDGRVLLKCHAGCPTEAVLDRLGLTMTDLFPPREETPRVLRATRYEVRDPAGRLVAVHARRDHSDGSKTFVWERPDGRSGLGGLRASELSLYGSHELGDAPAVVVAEGEKVREVLVREGVAAVGTVTGAAGTPGDEALRPLVGREIILWPDADEPGRRHMERVASRLVALGQQPDLIRMVEWPDAPKGGDAADFVTTGEDLAALLGAAPVWTPPAEPAAAEPAGPFVPGACAEAPWPELDPAAFWGLAGELVRAVDPHTEADPVAVLVSFLALFGAAVGRSPHLMIGDDRHAANLFAALAGDTAKARKGSARGGPERVVTTADCEFAGRVVSGLGSGEGLIWAIRDEITGFDRKSGEMRATDLGVLDKRLLALEEELAAVLTVCERQGNTLSPVLRRAWDSRGKLQSLTKNSPAVATEPHIAVLAHITIDELRRALTESEIANGLGNRFVWFVVRRGKCLARPQPLPDSVVADLAARVASALRFARQCGAVAFDPEAAEAWDAIYPTLSEAKPGLAGALVARSEAQAIRLSLIYALLDRSPAIGVTHLSAALSLIDYVEASVRFIWGDATGDPIADRILRALRANGPMTQGEIVDLFGRNVPTSRLGQALETLLAMARIRSHREETGGRPRTIWEAAA